MLFHGGVNRFSLRDNVSFYLHFFVIFFLIKVKHVSGNLPAYLSLNCLSYGIVSYSFVAKRPRNPISHKFNSCDLPTDGLTDGPTDGPTLL